MTVQDTIGNEYVQHDWDSRPWTDKSKLQDLADMGLSQEEMAERLGCSGPTISRWIDKLDVEYDPRYDRSGPDKSLHPWFKVNSGGYEVAQSWNRHTGREEVSIHRLLAYSMGMEIEDKDVHHKNGVPWDNRPDNIEALTRKEHRRIHG